MEVAGHGRRYLPTSWPEGTSQMRRVASRLTLSSQRASALHAKSVIVLVWPPNLRTSLQVSTSKTRSVRSSHESPTRAESWGCLRVVTGAPASTRRSGVRACAFHTRSVPSWPPLRSVLPSASAASPRTGPSCRAETAQVARCWPDCKLNLSRAPDWLPR
eukprot:scaffold40600_cov62-Phaeocystis_antarctica.AAC.5